VRERRRDAALEQLVDDVARQDGDRVRLAAEHRLHAAHRDRFHDRHRRRHAGGDEDRVVEPAHRRVGRRQDPVELGELRPVERPARQALLVARRHDEARLLLVDRLLHDPRRIAFVRAADRAVELAREHAADELVGGAFDDESGEARRLPEQCLQRCRQQRLRHLRRNADAHAPAVAGVDGGEDVRRRLDVRQPALRMEQHGVAGGGGRQAAARSREKGSAEDVLDLAQRLGDRRLAEAHLVGDAVQRAMPVDRLQQRQLSHLQARQHGVLDRAGGVLRRHNREVIAGSENSACG